MRLPMLVAAFAVLSATLASTSAHADSIVYDASESSAGVYVYDLNVTSAFSLDSGNTITFSGLAGVTDASTTYSGNFSTSYTSTSVTFTAKQPVAFGVTDYLDVFTIDSTAAPGTINYASTGTSPILSGTIEGPDVLPAATPEPSSIALLGTGLLGIAGVLRKRLA